MSRVSKNIIELVSKGNIKDQSDATLQSRASIENVFHLFIAAEIFVI